MKNTTEQPSYIHIRHGLLDVAGLPAFNDNVIWLLCAVPAETTPNRCVTVVDPGDAAPVIAYCRQHRLLPTTILLTHHHADHTGGVAALRRWVSEIDPTASVTVYGPAVEEIPDVTDPLSGGEMLDVGHGVTFQVLSVPGHTRGHLAYVLNVTSQIAPTAVFCGDLLFGLGCGRLFEGTAAQMHAALMQICALPDEARIYCAHEYTWMNLPFALSVDPGNAALQARAKQIRALRLAGQSTLPLLLAAEKATNPFLRADQPALREAVCAEESATPLAVFTRLRAMRDTFKAS